ncbi:NUDIX domain-containing protein [Streptomyces sp. HU2014]|uniref:NUDIX domain-containing protein n=1 Tax=Streptomyces sp. HU2014 TaxID=2939414 RepID=UPI00200EAA58|nr:NUDIX domain-containing protein [Streptomyces sp. HU2014]UQI46696.1 NUDIX domain-containing protein [Streptomyces sp. HU2014]
MAHADIDPAHPPKRRLGALVLVRDDAGRILLVKPTYRSGWVLPGGAAHQGESIADAAARELAEETGLVRRPTHYLVLDQVPASDDGTSAEGLNVVCDAGDQLTAEEAKTVVVPETAADELCAVRWVPPEDLDKYAQPYQARRIRAALATLESDAARPLLTLGEPAGA